MATGLISLLSSMRSRLKVKKITKINLKAPVYLDRHMGKDFLILVTGPNIKRHSKSVLKIIKEKAPIVIGCNNIPDIYAPDYHIFVNRRRFCDYGSHIKQGSKILLSPYFTRGQIGPVIGEREYEEVMFKNIYPCEEADISMRDGIVYAKGATVGIIAIGVALAMGAKDIFIGGMDGYSIDKKNPHHYHEKDHKAIEELLKQESLMKGLLKRLDTIVKGRNGNMKIITPTAYNDYYDPMVI